MSKRDSRNSDHYTINSSAVATENTSTGLGTVTNRPIIVNGTHFFPQGESDVIRRWNGSEWRDEAASQYATFLIVGHDQADGPVVWREFHNWNFGQCLGVACKHTIIRCADCVGSGRNIHADVGTSIPVGDTTTGINNMYFWTNNGLYIYKPDAVYTVANDRAIYLDYGLQMFHPPTMALA